MAERGSRAALVPYRSTRTRVSASLFWLWWDRWRKMCFRERVGRARASSPSLWAACQRRGESQALPSLSARLLWGCCCPVAKTFPELPLDVGLAAAPCARAASRRLAGHRPNHAAACCRYENPLLLRSQRFGAVVYVCESQMVAWKPVTFCELLRLAEGVSLSP